MASAMNEQRFLDDLMFDAHEDYIRLWDVMSLASAAFPGLSPAQHEDMAKRTVRALLDRGWVDVFHREWMGTKPGPASVVDPIEAIAVLDRAESWDDQANGPQYVFFRTDRGAREFAEDLRRRGLLRR